MAKCKSCGAEDVKVGGCFSCMITGCELCLSDKHTSATRGCRTCGDRQRYSAESLVGLACSVCGHTEAAREWVLLAEFMDWDEDGEMIYIHEPVCDQCLSKRHKKVKERFEVVHGEPMSKHSRSDDEDQ